jgi:hypothetical protein
MPYDFEAMRAAGRAQKTAAEMAGSSKIRERFYSLKLAQADEAYIAKLDELQRGLPSGLSPATLDRKQFELDALRDLRTNLRNSLVTIARQDDAERATDFGSDLDEDEPVGGYRTQRAYLDQLQRERAKVASLSRAQFERVKERSAKRPRNRPGGARGIDIDPDTVFAQEHPTWWTQNNAVPNYLFAKETLTGVDPCIDWCAKQKVRRQVMAAQGQFKGHRGKRRYPHPCQGKC